MQNLLIIFHSLPYHTHSQKSYLYFLHYAIILNANQPIFSSLKILNAYIN